MAFPELKPPEAPRAQRVVTGAHVYTLPIVRELPSPSGEAPGAVRLW